MAQTTPPKPEDVATSILYKWGGIGIIAVVILLIIVYIFSIAVSFMINTINALERVAGILGLIALSVLVGAVLGIAIYAYITKRITP